MSRRGRLGARQRADDHGRADGLHRLQGDVAGTGCRLGARDRQGRAGRRPVAADAGVRGFADARTRSPGSSSHIRTFCKEPGWPSGNTNFPRPILTEKAFPENEFVILPAVSHWNEDPAPSITESSVTAVYERRIGKRSMIEIEVPLVAPIRWQPGPAASATSPWPSSMRSTRARIRRDLVVGPRNRIANRRSIQGSRLGHDDCRAVHQRRRNAARLVPADADQSGAACRPRPADRAIVYNAYVGRDTSAAPNTWTLGVELNGE